MPRIRLVAECEALALAAPVRPVAEFESELLAHLMVDAYSGTPDWEEGDSVEVALAEIRAVTSGEYGNFLDYASGVLASREGLPMAAIFVSMFEETPTVMFVYTGKAFAKQGHASVLIRNAAHALAVQGLPQLALFVNEANPAVNLYRRLGFTA